ncbi:hypothetical protein N657DRAFT_384206 [Parathielavia appendiculata]|uniref:Uncharacterized protein n=1 Tax=Parathielavia appendiculata TaxID=2587402 RepID=A0AAN6Z426_9PEZI|nr:hypothetical protein N657DRAFT_384206 [Parathielavia appendiculata]
MAWRDPHRVRKLRFSITWVNTVKYFMSFGAWLTTATHILNRLRSGLLLDYRTWVMRIDGVDRCLGEMGPLLARQT